jgi:hypothetical protein
MAEPLYLDAFVNHRADRVAREKVRHERGTAARWLSTMSVEL